MKPVLVISDRDNVATALEALEPGRRLDINGGTVFVREPIPSGHKVALQPIAAGKPVIKYGSPIGLASADIVAGSHVHVHNVSSTRGRGDLEQPPSFELTRVSPPLDANAASDGRALSPSPFDDAQDDPESIGGAIRRTADPEVVEEADRPEPRLAEPPDDWARSRVSSRNEPRSIETQSRKK